MDMVESVFGTVMNMVGSVMNMVRAYDIKGSDRAPKIVNFRNGSNESPGKVARNEYTWYVKLCKKDNHNNDNNNNNNV